MQWPEYTCRHITEVTNLYHAVSGLYHAVSMSFFCKRCPKKVNIFVGVGLLVFWKLVALW